MQPKTSGKNCCLLRSDKRFFESCSDGWRRENFLNIQAEGFTVVVHSTTCKSCGFYWQKATYFLLPIPPLLPSENKINEGFVRESVWETNLKNCNLARFYKHKVSTFALKFNKDYGENSLSISSPLPPVFSRLVIRIQTFPVDKTLPSFLLLLFFSKESFFSPRNWRTSKREKKGEVNRSENLWLQKVAL